MVAVERRPEPVIAEPSHPPVRPMFRGREMLCPRCKTYHDILAYVPLVQIEEYVKDTHWITKCPDCKWLFSPKVEPVLIDLQDGDE